MLFRKYSLAGCCFLLGCAVYAQELFPLTEPASSVPKHVIGVRAYSQNYKDGGLNRTIEVLRVMYGLTSKLSVMVSGSASNHHSRKLPPELVYHTRGVRYPYLFNGIYLYAKYRVLSFDKKNQHFRIAGYAEWSNVKVTHREAEPSIMDDTGGYGLGVISTYLKNRFAASVTYGIIRPNPFFNTQQYYRDGPEIPTKIYYGNAIRYTLSLGYRFAPDHYTDYQQTNKNLYVEFIGKKYDAATIYQNGVNLNLLTPEFRAGNYVEMHPGAQWIFNSNLRVDLSVGFNIWNMSYVRSYPIWTLAVQRYFYRKQKNKTR